MCGIAGIIGANKESSIARMTEIISHRGPDDEGFYHDDVISLGQRRLSINDIEGGKQPISNENDTLQLICNGEIYNSPELRKELIGKGHRFKTTTDVEVILHLYEECGLDCIKKLRGMFAFALWDTKNNRLILARDHIGQKPLFFYHGENGFAFASEVKGVLSSDLISPEIDLEGLWHYMSLRFIPDQYSLFKKIQKLPAASFLVFENDSLKIHKYWELSFEEKMSKKEGAILDELDDLLRFTVKDHLLSDVQVGAFLSGGIDSSTVTALMSTLTGERIPTFSIGVKEQGFNELPYARMVAERYELDAREKVVEADLVNLIPSMVFHMDEPSDPFAVGVYLVSREASKDVKVVLGGDGGDENFAGYDRFIGQRLVDYYCVFPKWFRKHVAARVVNYIPETFGYKSIAQKARWLNEMSFYDGGRRYAQSMSTLRFTQEAKDELFTDHAKNQIKDSDSIEKILHFFNADNVDHAIDRMLHTDLMTRIPDHLLALVDRMSMAHSLEVRSPFVDYKMVEFAARIPAALKLKGHTLKYVLRKIASRYLSKELVYRKKQGFGFPIGMWLRKELRHLLVNLMKESRFVELGLFDANYVQQVVGEHLSGKADNTYRLWILLNLEVWHRIFFENQSQTQVADKIQELSLENHSI